MGVDGGEPPDQAGKAGPGEGTTEDGQLQTSGDHRAASALAVVPIKRGSGFPAAIRFIHTNSPT